MVPDGAHEEGLRAQLAERAVAKYNRRVEGVIFTAPIKESLTGLILRRFQEQHKLAITGQPDEATRNRLRAEHKS